MPEQTEHDTEILRDEIHAPGIERENFLDNLNMDELAAQMASIAQEVANVQMEMEKIKGDALQDISHQLQALKSDAANLQCESVESLSSGSDDVDDLTDDDGNNTADDEISSLNRSQILEETMSEKDAQSHLEPLDSRTSVYSNDCAHPSPSLRRVSSYGAQGKLTPSKRRISWSESVVDNAKSPGEDSLSDIIKKRSMRHRARQRGEGSTLAQTIFYCLLVFLLSNMVPRLLQQLSNVRAMINDNAESPTEDDHYFDGGEGEF